MDEESLDYVSSAPLLATAPPEKNVDENQVDTLKEVQKLLSNRQEYYLTSDALSLENKIFTLEQQLAINKQVVFHLREIQSLIKATVNSVEEKNNGR